MNEANEPETTEQVEQQETEAQTVEQQLEKLQADKLKIEQAMTKQSYELGELRKLKPVVDDFLLNKRMQANQQPEIDIFEKPAEAVNQKIESNPKIQELERKLESVEQNRSAQMLAEKHPDYQEVVQSADFASWVQQSPIRQQLMNMADQHYNFDAANELLTNFKSIKVAGVAEVQESDRKQNLKNAKVSVGSGATGRKTYTRRELIQMKINNPEQYAALNVQQLYSSGRVK